VQHSGDLCRRRRFDESRKSSEVEEDDDDVLLVGPKDLDHPIGKDGFNHWRWNKATKPIDR